MERERGERETDRQSDRQRDRDKERGTETKTQRDRQAGRDRQRQRDRETDRDRQRDTERHRERQRDRDRDAWIPSVFSGRLSTLMLIKLCRIVDDTLATVLSVVRACMANASRRTVPYIAIATSLQSPAWSCSAAARCL